ncbi:NUDIX domain-containing protein [uncultured Tenacibaculum sp.]|uniref:NUDIX domain-containing protein n=1 Tax=uncultured Tenacibaculum sp. TaxID=174713 RepID=UPI0026111B7C|nr:NUDIX domain-containing protein [uncultured Tenacibaculum sp.]
MKIVKEYSSGGVIFRKVDNKNKEVLLIRVRKNGFELPKGHIEQGESESQAAIRECKEEVGIINDLVLGDKVGEIAYSFISENKTIQKKVSYYSITFSGVFNYIKPKNTREIIWISERELETIELVNEELRSIIAKCLL